MSQTDNELLRGRTGVPRHRGSGALILTWRRVVQHCCWLELVGGFVGLIVCCGSNGARIESRVCSDPCLVIQWRFDFILGENTFIFT